MAAVELLEKNTSREILGYAFLGNGRLGASVKENLILRR